MKERWRTIKSHPRYQVSDLGRVRSLTRKIRDGRIMPGRIIKLCGKKYLMCGLSNGKVAKVYVHRLVLEAFRGPCPPGLEGCHNNGDARDCKLDNLRWDTRKANAADCTAHGRRRVKCGEQHYHAKLNANKVHTIRKLRKQGWQYKDIAAKMNVSTSTAGNVGRGTQWRHVT
jgi:HNH endonuclease/NUMOD4 motif-containing protein